MFVPHLPQLNKILFNLRLFGIVYLLLLAYIVAALLFWGFSLHRQSGQIYIQELGNLQASVDSTAMPQVYKQRLVVLQEHREMRAHQYLGEGLTFLIIILVGALVVYTSMRRNMRLSRQQNNFMLSVTHELKSPIAAIKLNVETLLKRKLTEEQNRTLLLRSLTESDRLNDLCNNMLLASQMEGRQYKAANTTINLSELVFQHARAYATRYSGRVNMEGIEDNLMMVGDELLMGMAISNLLENAIKYTSAIADPIQVSLSRNHKNMLVFQVADRGPGIKDTEKEKIFQKFYRIGEEGTRSTKGTGLGLYLTLKIVKQHKGKVSIRDNKPQGSVFQICLPATVG